MPIRARHDGWTPERQRGFIRALADTGCVEQACRHVGLSVTAAYTLRRRLDAIEFRAAWDAALDVAVGQLEDAVLSRAIHGVEVPHFFRGEQVGSRRVYNDGLAMWLLRYRRPDRYGTIADRARPGLHPQRFALLLASRLDWMVKAGAGLLPGLRKRLERTGPDSGGESPETS